MTNGYYVKKCGDDLEIINQFETGSDIKYDTDMKIEYEPTPNVCKDINEMMKLGNSSNILFYLGNVIEKLYSRLQHERDIRSRLERELKDILYKDFTIEMENYMNEMRKENGLYKEELRQGHKHKNKFLEINDRLRIIEHCLGINREGLYH